MCDNFCVFFAWWVEQEGLDDLMESKGGKKKSSSSSSKSLFYEAPLGYSIEDIRPNGGIKKFRSAAYSNVGIHVHSNCTPDGFDLVYLRILNSYIFFNFSSLLASHPDISKVGCQTT